MADPRQDPTTDAAASSSFRIASLEIENYKGIDHLSLDFPAPSTVDQRDVFVIGSRNGVGKTSVLECCALAVMAGIIPAQLKEALRPGASALPRGILVRAEAKMVVLRPRWRIHGVDRSTEFAIAPHGLVSRPDLGFIQSSDPERWSSGTDFDIVGSLLGLTPDPLILPPVLLFHSYRKIVEGNPDLVNAGGGSAPRSTFKSVLVQALMARSGLFEGPTSQEEGEATLNQLNDLLREFAGGTVDKLRPSANGTVDLRVAPTSGAASFSFDGLSSGQKEIIATLFLIWHATQNQPSLVLIDEPELHLNAEWQRVFVHRLTELAPWNQYILATHAEEIFGSVSQDRRILLSQG